MATHAALSHVDGAIESMMKLAIRATNATKQRASPQAGIIDGSNPTAYNASNPIILFIIQAGMIIIFCRLLHFPLSRLRQPRVIAEVIGGILLGPSVMGRIPGFTDAIFPAASMPVLSNVANLGLILFLFLVGLEVDLRLFLSNWRVALSVGAAGMAVPFGLGCAVAYGLYHQFRDDPATVPISFGVYMLFIGVAMAITAFPVLCRILSELKLLSTDVGVIVLSAGVGNDVCGWILLALTIALVNSGTGITALWVLMACLAWTLFLVYLVRPAFIWLLQRSGSIRNGPTQAIVALTLLLALTSAFFTGIIGVHPIFGAFLVGLICPHDGGFAIKLTEKIEDLVSTLFLPIYFTLSGLSTNIGLLNDGITWAYVVAVILTAFFGKVIGGTLAARFNKLVWKESFTIGVLMSCKGLIELIVLNIGLQAKILSVRVFTIFVVMALVTTFATTPIVSTIYTPAYQRKLAKWKRGEIDWDGNPLAPRDSDDLDGSFEAKLETKKIQKVLLYFRLDSLSSLFTFVALLSGSKEIQSTTRTHPAKRTSANDQAEAQNLAAKPLEVHGVRLVELTERTSTVMQISELDDHSSNDPVVNVLYTFGQMNNVAVSGGVAVVPEDSYGEALSSKAHDLSSDLVLIPWSDTTRATTLASSRLLSPDTTEHRFTAGSHNDFIQQSLANTSCNTAIIVNKGFGGLHGNRDEARSLSRTISGISMSSIRDRTPLAPISDLSHHVFMPYFGGADDQAALRFVLQLAQNTSVTATIVYVGMGRAPGSAGPHSSSVDVPETSHVASSLDKIRQKSGSIITHLTGQSKSTKIALGTHESDSNRAFYKTLQDSLPEALVSRVVFEDLKSAVSVQALFDKIQSEVGKSPKNAGDLIVVGRTHADEIDSALYEHNAGNGTSSEMGTSLGALAGAILRKGFPASLLMMQARTDHGRRH